MMPREWWEYETDPVASYQPRSLDINLRWQLMGGRGGGYSEEQRRLAMPVAEVICMLKRESVRDYEKYLDMACELMDLNKRAHELSWVQDTLHENPTVREAWAQWRMTKALSARSRP